MDLAVESAIKVRHYQRGDFVAHLLKEYCTLELDPKVTWVVEKDGVIVAVLLAAYGSQMAVLIRLAASSDAPPTWLLALLRNAACDLEAMGAKAVIVAVSVDHLPELKMARLIQRAGGSLQPMAGFIAAFSIQQMRKL